MKKYKNARKVTNSVRTYEVGHDSVTKIKVFEPQESGQSHYADIYFNAPLISRLYRPELVEGMDKTHTEVPQVDTSYYANEEECRNCEDVEDCWVGKKVAPVSEEVLKNQFYTFPQPHTKLYEIYGEDWMDQVQFANSLRNKIQEGTGNPEVGELASSLLRPEPVTKQQFNKMVEELMEAWESGRMSDRQHLVFMDICDFALKYHVTQEGSEEVDEDMKERETMKDLYGEDWRNTNARRYDLWESLIKQSDHRHLASILANPMPIPLARLEEWEDEVARLALSGKLPEEYLLLLDETSDFIREYQLKPDPNYDNSHPTKSLTEQINERHKTPKKPVPYPTLLEALKSVVKNNQPHHTTNFNKGKDLLVSVKFEKSYVYYLISEHPTGYKVREFMSVSDVPSGGNIEVQILKMAIDENLKKLEKERQAIRNKAGGKPTDTQENIIATKTAQIHAYTRVSNTIQKGILQPHISNLCSEMVEDLMELRNE